MRLLIIALLVFCSLKMNATDSNDASVQGLLTFDIPNSVLRVKINYSLKNENQKLQKVSFYLSGDAKNLQVYGDAVKSYNSDTSSKIERMIHVMSKESSGIYSRDIVFQYEIPIDSQVLASGGFIELGLDWFWFPVHEKMNEWKLLYNLDIEGVSGDMQVFSNGRVKAHEKGRYQLISKYADFDINLFILKNPAIYSIGIGQPTVVGTKDQSQMKDSIAQLTIDYLKYYNNLYEPDFKEVTFIIRPSVLGGASFGYARKGYMVLTSPSNVDDVKFYIAHELAHLWFLNGEPAENAWLTESMAEYNAMLLMRTLEGNEKYSKIILDKKERLNSILKNGKKVPALYKNGTQGKTLLSQIALYHYGPLLLADLERNISPLKMQKLLQTVSLGKINTTEDFLERLEFLENGRIRKYFQDTLYKPLSEKIETNKSSATLKHKSYDFFSTLQSLSGEPIDLRMTSAKVILIDFWASWCIPCRREFPQLISLYRNYRDKGFEIIGISIDEEKGNWKDAVKRDNLTWPQLIDDAPSFTGIASQSFSITSIPANILITREGSIVAANLKNRELEIEIKKILKTQD